MARSIWSTTSGWRIPSPSQGRTSRTSTTTSDRQIRQQRTHNLQWGLNQDRGILHSMGAILGSKQQQFYHEQCLPTSHVLPNLHPRPLGERVGGRVEPMAQLSNTEWCARHAGRPMDQSSLCLHAKVCQHARE